MAKICQPKSIPKPHSKGAKKKSLLDTLELTAENSLRIEAKNTPTLSKETLLKSVKRKSFQNYYLPYLVQLAEQEKNEYWRLRAWKVYHCAEALVISEGEYMRHRCKLSECLICQGYKTSQRIKAHIPTLNQFPDLQFMTLTVPNVLVCNLRPTIGQMSKVFRSVIDRMRKQGYKPKGSRNLEDTFNIDKSNFHPHFHCVIEGKETAELFLKYWIEAWAKKGIKLSIKAQHIRPFGSRESDLLEAFKYANKIITTDDKNQRKINSWGLYESIKATSGGKGGIRTFQTFGFTKGQFKVEKQSLNMSVDKSLPNGSYTFIHDKEANFFDYADTQTGLTLTDYTMPDKLKELLDNNIV